jgi:signal transduction histidine kinase
MRSEKQHKDQLKVKALLIEDNSADADLILRELTREGFDVSLNIIETPDQLRRQLQDSPPDFILSDYNLKNWEGMEALEIVKGTKLDIPFILVSGSLGEVAAVELIKRGVTDYILKDALARLPVAVRRALAEKELRSQKRTVEIELERSNHDLEQFAFIASHDLQEPLRMMAIYAEMLGECCGKAGGDADKYIHYVIDGATRMKAMIKDLLEFSRIGNDGTEIKATDSEPLLTAALLNLTAAIQESGAQILQDCLPTVMANSSQLQQVFQNLIGNAIKFRGTRSPVIKISAERRNAEWVFAVSDNGIGIAAEHVDTVFAIFQRLHTKTEYTGNGIGLAICKKVIERLGGRIWIESHPRAGTTFKFTLPGAMPEDAGTEHVFIYPQNMSASA